MQRAQNVVSGFFGGILLGFMSTAAVGVPAAALVSCAFGPLERTLPGALAGVIVHAGGWGLLGAVLGTLLCSSDAKEKGWSSVLRLGLTWFVVLLLAGALVGAWTGWVLSLLEWRITGWVGGLNAAVAGVPLGAAAGILAGIAGKEPKALRRGRAR